MEHVHVRNEKAEKTLPMVIVEGEGPNLLG